MIITAMKAMVRRIAALRNGETSVEIESNISARHVGKNKIQGTATTTSQDILRKDNRRTQRTRMPSEIAKYHLGMET